MSEIKERVGAYNVLIEYHKGVIIDYDKKNNVSLETVTNMTGGLKDIKVVNEEKITVFVRTDEGKEISMPIPKWGGKFRKGSNILWGNFQTAKKEKKSSKKPLFIKNLDTNFSKIEVNKTPKSARVPVYALWSVLYFVVLGGLLGLISWGIGYEFITKSMDLTMGLLTSTVFLTLFYPAFLKSMKSNVAIIDMVYERAQEIIKKYD